MHSFHIPVLGLGYSIDTPLKVARYGISSVISIVDDELIERMREYHCQQNNIDYTPIRKNETESRSRRITTYLNLLNLLINKQFEALKEMPFCSGMDIDRYFDLLPEPSRLKQGYDLMKEYPVPEGKMLFEQLLKKQMETGAIDVNIMAKVDKMNFDAEGNYTGDNHTDALAALKGFAESDLQSSVVLSAGMNPRLYSYLETFDCFYPGETGKLNKRIILKVSDFRSALIQAKFLAKKGIWVSEFRIESGLNCGGHAFATDGLLLGPILEEFKQKREDMQQELLRMYHAALADKGYSLISPLQRISVQGGIGTGQEDVFLREHYQLDATGWGSPFLLVPEATNVDEQTLQQLAGASHEDFYVSSSSPLGILFNNFSKSTAERQRLTRIEQGRPGSPCNKKYLVNNTEFTEQPICTASREYQHLKIKQLRASGLNENETEQQINAVTEKVCLCEGLCASAFIKNDILKPRENKSVTVCPGPNIAFFSRSYTLDEMVAHIYNKINLLERIERPNMFINELNLYIDYLKKDMAGYVVSLNEKKGKYLQKFKDQLQQGIAYYKEMIPQITGQSQEYLEKMIADLTASEFKLSLLSI